MNLSLTTILLKQLTFNDSNTTYEIYRALFTKMNISGYPPVLKEVRLKLLLYRDIQSVFCSVICGVSFLLKRHNLGSAHI